MSKHMERTGTHGDDLKVSITGLSDKDSRQTKPMFSTQAKLLLLVHTLFIIAGAL